jgi:hypothetical protein
MGGRKRTNWVADFETTTREDDCRVWGWGLAHVETAEALDDVEIGTDMDSFIERVSDMDAVVYFHNLAFDGSFIMDWLFRQGYTHTLDRPRAGTFSSLISKMGAFYSITVAWDNGTRTEFRDSYKKLPMSVRNVGKAFKLDEAKGDIDYHAERPIGYVPTPEEREYIALDVLIVARALKTQFDTGMTKLTVGADSLAEFKKLMGKRYLRMFPVLPESMDAEIRAAYRGGFTYADPRFKGKITGAGKVYDVNSLYPSVMYKELLPYGEPVWCEGLPTPTQHYPLFIASITFTAKLKKNHIPCIQVKGSSRFVPTEYQTHIKEPVTMTCTNVDLALWQDHYDLDILQYNGGWLFHGITGVFCEFIDKWMEIKATSDGGVRVLAKLQLNSLYGKFATNPDVTPKVPVFEDDIVKLRLGDPDSKDPVYTAMGVFITAYARDVTVRAAQQHYDVFAYADTDSLHLLSSDTMLDVDPHKLGAWKHEYDFDAALFLRAKQYTERLIPGTYKEEPGQEWHPPLRLKQVTHIAGLPVNIAAQIHFEDITNGRVFPDKLVPKRVPGGVVLQDIGFTMTL